jgi:D-alanine-D-alanine ligase
MVDLGRKIRVAVLMGGISSERNISLSTGKQILESLDTQRYEAFGVDAALLPGSTRAYLKGADQEISAVAAARDALAASTSLATVERIASSDPGVRPDVVFIALHGKFGEDGTIQGMLELLGIPYTGSGVLASALAMDKSMAKKVMAADGIPVPESVDFVVRDSNWDVNSIADAVAELGYPVIVKPSCQGSSFGLRKVSGPGELNHAIKEAAAYDERIIVERFVAGRELTVGVLGTNEPFALPVTEIVPKNAFYDYESKYATGGSEHIVPAGITDEQAARAQELGLAAHKSLGCRGVSRTDIILSGDSMYVLEVNTIPGMTPTSLLPEAARVAGIPFGRLLDMLIEFALEEGTQR